MKPVLPTDQDERNEIPLADGCLYYFPNALAEIAKLSKTANEQHNPGEPMHWARNKSTDHANKILKHQVDAGLRDKDDARHSTKVAWRALAQLEDELIAAGATPGRNAVGSPPTEKAELQPSVCADKDGWIPWNAAPHSKCPLPVGTEVDVRHADGEEYYTATAGAGVAFNWSDSAGSGRIVAYRLAR